MSDMRKLINLMEGIGLNEAKFKNVSCSQCGMAFGPGDEGFSHCEQHKNKTPVDEDMNVGGVESDMQTADTDNRNSAYAAFDAGQSPASESVLDEIAPPGMEKIVKDIKKEYPGHPEKAFATAWSIYNKKHGKTEEGYEMEETEYPDIESSMHPVNIIRSVISQLHPGPTSAEAVAREVPHLSRDPNFMQMYKQATNSFYGFTDSEENDEEDDDYTDWSMRRGEMGMEEDQETTLPEDLNNGYDSVEYASGNDFFPNGADSPVIKKVGPSGARQGDNPEQKKMQVDEELKELVYAYRKFLKEAKK